MRTLLSTIVTLMLVGQGSASDEKCLQKNARYIDADKVVEIQFTDLGSETGLSSNTFTVKPVETEVSMKGWVLWNNAVSRPNGVITYQFPDGDITGEELDACTVWDGVVYSVWRDGTVDLLPPGDDPAASKILLPDFGRKLRYSAVWTDKKMESVPWDAFSYSGCSAAK